MHILYHIGIIIAAIWSKYVQTYAQSKRQEDDQEHQEEEAEQAQERHTNSNEQEEEQEVSRAKKNRSIDENRAISQRVDELRMQGLNKERATAAAFRMFKDGELTVRVDNVRAVGKKTAQDVAIEKAVIAAATRLRQKAEQDKRRMQRAEILARRAKLKAKKTGEPETAQELESRLRTEPIARTIPRLRRRQI